MDRQIPQLPAHARHLDFNLFLAPAQDSREERVAVRTDGLEHVDLVVTAEVFEFGVFGPGALGELRLLDDFNLVQGRCPPCKSPL